MRRHVTHYFSSLPGRSFFCVFQFLNQQVQDRLVPKDVDPFQTKTADRGFVQASFPPKEVKIPPNQDKKSRRRRRKAAETIGVVETPPRLKTLTTNNSFEGLKFPHSYDRGFKTCQGPTRKKPRGRK
jgi:hypothetical protein